MSTNADHAQTPSPTLTLSQLPGPPGLPLLGNLLQVQPERFHLQLEAWARTYGPRYRLRLGRRELLVVSDSDAIVAALRDRPEVIGRTDRLVKGAAEMGFAGVFAANGNAWRRQRPMVMAGFDPSRLKTYFPQLVAVTQRFAARWRRAAASGARIDLSADLMRYTVDVVAGLALGADINTLEQGDDVIQQHLDKVLPAFARRLIAPWAYWRWLKLPADHRLDAHVAALHQAVAGFIAQARARLAASAALRAAPANLVEAMLIERDREGSALTDADVSGNVLTLLLAGEDTTANTLAWAIDLLWRNPAALARAQMEVRQALGADLVPTSPETLAGLEFLEACLHETMRLKPVAPIQVAQARKATTVAGVARPAGSLMLFLTRPAALDARLLAEPEAFLPQRWLVASPQGGDGADRAQGHAALGEVTGACTNAVSTSAQAARRISMPFGAGPRICPGRALALQEMKMVLAMLLAGFDVLAVDTPDQGPTQERLAFTMSPLGLTMRLQLRADGT